MTVRDLDLDFEQFFANGERLTDAVELLVFARNSDARGNATEALQLYRWTGELLAECPPDPDLAELRAEVESAVRRLCSATQKRGG